MEKYERLEKILKLKQDGILSEEEFQIEKKKILNFEENENKGQNNTGTIIEEYTEKINQEKKSSKKKTIKIAVITFVVAIIIILIPAAIITINSNIQRDKNEKLKVSVPNLIGKTYNQAQKELSDMGLNIKTMYGSSDNAEAIVTEQSKKAGYTMKKGETIEIKVLTKEEIEKQELEQKKKNEESNAIWKACSEYAKIVEAQNEGSVKYVYPSHYGTTDDSGKVYKLKYKTSNEGLYYYQLVSFDANYTKVIKSTKLFSFYEMYGEEHGQTQELDYAYKTTF